MTCGLRAVTAQFTREQKIENYTMNNTGEKIIIAAMIAMTLTTADSLNNDVKHA